MTEERGENFIQIFRFTDDVSKEGRVLSTAKVGDIYMSRLTIEPGIVTGNRFHKDTMRMFYVEKGKILAVFEHVDTKERQEVYMEPGRHAIHVPENVAFATKNVGKENAVIVLFTNNPSRSEDNFHYELLD